jgi:hypothetical protein
MALVPLIIAPNSRVLCLASDSMSGTPAHLQTARHKMSHLRQEHHLFHDFPLAKVGTPL